MGTWTFSWPADQLGSCYSPGTLRSLIGAEVPLRLPDGSVICGRITAADIAPGEQSSYEFTAEFPDLEFPVPGWLRSVSPQQAEPADPEPGRKSPGTPC